MGFAVIPDESERNMIDRIFEDASAINVRLYTNDLTPDQDTVLGDMIEASYDGYAPQGVAWDVVATVGHKATLGDHDVSFTGPASGGPVDVYGWYMTATYGFGERLVMVKRLTTSPRTLTDGTDELSVNVEFRGLDFHQP